MIIELLGINAFNYRSSEHSKEGAYIHGLFIEGADWNIEEGRLSEQIPRVIINKFPGIHLIVSIIFFEKFSRFRIISHFQPIHKDLLQENGRYTCPLYKTNERNGTLNTIGLSSNFVIAILLNTNENPDYWIKRGVALVCQTNN